MATYKLQQGTCIPYCFHLPDVMLTIAFFVNEIHLSKNVISSHGIIVRDCILMYETTILCRKVDKIDRHVGHLEVRQSQSIKL